MIGPRRAPVATATESWPTPPSHHPQGAYQPDPVVRSEEMAPPPDIADIAVRGAKTLRAFGQRIPGAGEVLARSLEGSVAGRTC